MPCPLCVFCVLCRGQHTPEKPNCAYIEYIWDREFPGTREKTTNEITSRNLS